MKTAKAVRLDLLDFKSVQMRTFHLTWFAFFLSFFAWFGIAPLMPVVRHDLGLTKEQIGNCIIASVSITILGRLLMGWLCDRIGARRTYSALLILGSLPVMAIGLAHDYTSFLLFRLGIGVIGASFVITQYHTSVMFAPNCVGTANATSAGWGNLGGGITQMVMPLVLAAVLSCGADAALGWRLSMLFPGIALLITGLAYYRFTKDFPEGNIDELRRQGLVPQRAEAKGSFRAAIMDPRVLALAVMYAASFGTELTIDNVAALYYTDQFHLNLVRAGLVAGLFGFMNIFARSLGGICSDWFAHRGGLRSRVRFLGIVLFMGGTVITAFSQIKVLPEAIAVMVTFALFIKMANGANYSVVPFVNKKALGAVAGIVGAGGNVGGMLFGFLFRQQSYASAFFYLGCFVMLAAGMSLFIRFSAEHEQDSKKAFHAARVQKLQTAAV
ncbi:MAG: MFS transporter [Candidatus Omnitrophica bacterium]|nr:MFS transporter [Candidatus Omnitrophota bacterium]MDE2231425.1 MFS transporter [Candidatus Omnitrophota bacterium]